MTSSRPGTGCGNKPARSRFYADRVDYADFQHDSIVGPQRFDLLHMLAAETLAVFVRHAAYEAAESGMRQTFIGMAHRGRLNVLAHVLQKPYAQILAEFKVSGLKMP